MRVWFKIIGSKREEKRSKWSTLTAGVIQMGSVDTVNRDYSIKRHTQALQFAAFCYKKGINKKYIYIYIKLVA